MRKILTSIKRATLSVIVLALAFSFFGATGSAQAAQQYTPQGVCGSGYKIQRSHELRGAKVYLLYNGSYNCVVTIKTASVGTPTLTTAGLQVAGSSWAYDTGEYKYYAGPVKQYGKGKCVRFFGYHAGSSFTSPWGNCS